MVTISLIMSWRASVSVNVRLCPIADAFSLAVSVIARFRVVLLRCKGASLRGNVHNSSRLTCRSTSFVPVKDGALDDFSTFESVCSVIRDPSAVMSS